MVGLKLKPKAEKALRSKLRVQRRVAALLQRKRSILLSPPARKGRIARISHYPRGRFENLGNIRLRWIKPNFFEFIPKRSRPFRFIRSNGEEIIPRNFFTDGSTIPRVMQWSEMLDRFGALPPSLLHDWEFDLHHCRQTKKSFEEVNNTMLEALRTLMDDGLVERDYAAFWLIEAGLNSFVARAYWNAMPPSCPLPPHAPE